MGLVFVVARQSDGSAILSVEVEEKLRENLAGAPARDLTPIAFSVGDLGEDAGPASHEVTFLVGDETEVVYRWAERGDNVAFAQCAAGEAMGVVALRFHLEENIFGEVRVPAGTDIPFRVVSVRARPPRPPRRP